jgi:hypothetical protein
MQRVGCVGARNRPWIRRSAFAIDEAPFLGRLRSLVVDEHVTTG